MSSLRRTLSIRHLVFKLNSRRAFHFHPAHRRQIIALRIEEQAVIQRFSRFQVGGSPGRITL